jgi:hypothetical protein
MTETENNEPEQTTDALAQESRAPDAQAATPSEPQEVVAP